MGDHLDTDQTKAQLEVLVDEDWVDSLAYARGWYGLTKVNFVHVYPQIPMLWFNIRLLI